ncbi:unnamed protein product [Arctia plantaginis]|uniref:Uncharacterized protein n=1 Tax=Arctia plantaginis TaxID=874455 RepID=A0A8S1BB85_ARCPL|nr:unnamed protein product [Arctia plantaginis]
MNMEIDYSAVGLLTSVCEAKNGDDTISDDSHVTWNFYTREQIEFFSKLRPSMDDFIGLGIIPIALTQPKLFDK